MNDPALAQHWEAKYRSGDDGWDIGQPSPVLTWLLQSAHRPPGPSRVFVPGCGSGHELPAIAAAGHRAVGIDFAPSAISASQARVTAAGCSEQVSLLAVDALRDHQQALPARQADRIFDQTFFCAITPDERPLWAAFLDHCLADDGECWMLHFRTAYTDRHPYDSTIDDVAAIIEPRALGIVERIDVGHLSIEKRRGRETLLRIRRG